MNRISFRSLFKAGCAALLVVAASGCETSPKPSSIGRAIDEASFAVPPGAGRGPATLAAADGQVQGSRSPLRQAEIYPAQAVVPGYGLQPRGVQRTSDGVEVNFDGASIVEVVREIIGNILGQPYTISPEVAGTVTLSTGGPVAERDLLLILETVLRMNDAALVNTGTGWVVAPVDQAVGRGEVEPLGGRPLQASPGAGVTVMPLRFISATTAAQFIQPLVRRPEDIRIDQARNLVLFAGTGPERQNVLETLAAVDVDWLAGQSVGIFPLSTARPEAIIPELNALFANRAVAQTSDARQSVQFLPVARLNAVLAVASSDEQLRQVQQWVARLDRGQSTSPQFYVYELKHALAEDVAKILNASFGNGAFTSGPEETSSSVFPAGPTPGGESTGIGAVPEESGGPLGQDVPTPPSLADALLGGPSTSGGAGTRNPFAGSTVVPNKQANTVVVRASPQVWATIEPTLMRLDTAPAQVLIEATIAEVVLNDSLRYGVQYFLDSGSFKVGFNTSSTTPELRNPSNLEPLASVPGFNFVYTGANSNITIDALARITDVRVLSSPSVVVRDNSEAVLSVGDQVPVTTRTAVSVEDPTAPVVNNIEYRDTGVILQVRPRINSDEVVSLEIGQEVSRVVEASTSAVSPTPTIQQRKITSQINVDSGQTVVLGGLIQEDEQRNRQRVPVLGDIPVVGNLFGSTVNSTGRTELIVFITPRVISSAQDARDVSEELRSRMRALRARGLGEPAVDKVLTPEPLPSLSPQPGPRRLPPATSDASPTVPAVPSRPQPQPPATPAPVTLGEAARGSTRLTVASAPPPVPAAEVRADVASAIPLGPVARLPMGLARAAPAPSPAPPRITVAALPVSLPLGLAEAAARPAARASAEVASEPAKATSAPTRAAANLPVPQVFPPILAPAAGARVATAL